MKVKRIIIAIVSILTLFLVTTLLYGKWQEKAWWKKFRKEMAAEATSSIPAGFVELREISPSIVYDIRYFGDHNFIGRRVDGYKAPKCFLVKEAANGLAKVQIELKKLSLSLKVYDCYRPQRAVDHFVRWAKDLTDTKMKKEFYPDVEKKNLLKGYIASKSAHSRGSAVDLTIVPVPTEQQEEYLDGMELRSCLLPYGKRFNDNMIDMGTGFDCFDLMSHTDSSKVGRDAQANRLLLQALMQGNGFTNYSKEWWHYSLKNEPFPDRHFNFEVN